MSLKKAFVMSRPDAVCVNISLMLVSRTTITSLVVNDERMTASVMQLQTKHQVPDGI